MKLDFIPYIHQLISDKSQKAIHKGYAQMEQVNPFIKYAYGERLVYDPGFRIRFIIIRTLQADLYEY